MFKWLTQYFRSGSPLADQTPYPLDMLTQIYPANTKSGQTITDRRALTLPALYRGVDLIGSTVARLPIDVLRRTAKGKDYDDKHQVAKLFRQPNPNTSKFTFIRTLTNNAILKGNGYGIIGRGMGGEPLEVWQVEPLYIYPLWQYGELVYHFCPPNGQQRYISCNDVIHVKGLSIDGMIGLSLIQLMAEALSIGIQARDYQSVSFANGRPPAYVIEGGPIDEEAQKLYREMLARKHSGVDAAMRPLFLTGGATAKALGVTAADQEIMASRTFTDQDIANMLGIPPHKLCLNVATSYSSLEAENKAFLNDCLMKWVESFQDEFNSKLRTEEEKSSDNVLIEFDLKSLLEADKKTEIELLINEMNNGLISRENAQQILNLPSDGSFRMPANIVMEPEKETDVTDVQADILPGVTITAIVDMATQVSAGTLAPEAAKGIMQLASPKTPANQIASIVDASASFDQTPPPAPAVAAPGPNQPQEGPQEAPGSTTDAKSVSQVEKQAPGVRGLMAHNLTRLRARVEKSPNGEHLSVIEETLAAFDPTTSKERAFQFLESTQPIEEILNQWKI